MHIDTKPRKRNAPRPAEKSALGFLQWLRGRNCYIGVGQNHTCRGKVRACHVDHAGDKGMGTKVSDRFSLPMCDGHHEEQHRIGWQSFEKKHNFTAVAATYPYWRAWPGHVAWERKLEERA